MMGYCVDCPDLEACHQGMSCDLSRRFAFAANLYQQKMKGNTTMSSNQKNVTPADVAAKAAEEKLVTVVPAQAEKAEKATEEPVAETEAPELKIVKGETVDKKTLKERVGELAKKAKGNKNVLIAAGTVATVSVLAFMKYAKKKAEEALVEAANEELAMDDVQTEAADDSAV